MRYPLKLGSNAAQENHDNNAMDEEQLPESDEYLDWQQPLLARGISADDYLYDIDQQQLVLSRTASQRYQQFSGLNTSFDRDANFEYMRSGAEQQASGMLTESDMSEEKPPTGSSSIYLWSSGNPGGSSSVQRDLGFWEGWNQESPFGEDAESDAGIKDFDNENAKINLDDKGYEKFQQSAAVAAFGPSRTTGNEVFSNYGDAPFASVPRRPTCNCSKSHCLKLYCLCFKEGYSCGRDCNCTTCQNTPENKKLVEDYRQKKKLRAEVESDEIFCNCRMSFCEKSYCACAKSGQGCSEFCKCFNCKNPKGAKPKHPR